MTCLDFFVEARDAPGKVLATERADAITGSDAMLPAFAVAALPGVGLAAAGPLLMAGWPGALVAALGLAGLVGLGSLGSLGFHTWGKRVGFGWHFTP